MIEDYNLELLSMNILIVDDNLKNFDVLLLETSLNVELLFPLPFLKNRFNKFDVIGLPELEL